MKNSKDELLSMCKSLKLDCSAKMTKNELVILLDQHNSVSSRRRSNIRKITPKKSPLSPRKITSSRTPLLSPRKIVNNSTNSNAEK